MNKVVEIQELGWQDYPKAWDYQEQLFQKIVAIKLANRNAELPVITPNYLLWATHPHV